MSYSHLWSTIPIGERNAVSYDELCEMWGVKTRIARMILHKLSAEDNGDDYILIRSCRNKGFYRTNDESLITAYRKECLNKGRNTFAPLKKIDRVLNANTEQYSFTNNLRVVREHNGLSQSDVCRMISGVDESLLSQMENGVVLPSPMLLFSLSRLYCVETDELISMEFYRT